MIESEWCQRPNRYWFKSILNPEKPELRAERKEQRRAKTSKSTENREERMIEKKERRALTLSRSTQRSPSIGPQNASGTPVNLDYAGAGAFSRTAADRRSQHRTPPVVR